MVRTRLFSPAQTGLLVAYGILVVLGLVVGFLLGVFLGFLYSAGAVILSAKLGPATLPVLAAATLLLILTILVVIVVGLLREYRRRGVWW